MRLDPSAAQLDLLDEARHVCEAIAPTLEGDPEYARQGMPSDGDSRAVYSALGRAGLIGVAWPSSVGGRGLHHVDAALVEEVLGYNWLPLSQYLLSCKTVGAALLRFGSGYLVPRLLPPIVHGELVFCQGFSEPGAGSDLASLTTSARLEGDQFVVRGHKIWTSGAHLSDWIYLAVRTDPEAPRHRGISILVAETQTPGISVRSFPTMGGGVLCEVVIEDAVVPRGQLVGELNGAWPVLMYTLDHERITAEKVGALTWMLDALEQVGVEPGRSADLDALRGELRACRLLSLRAAWLLDEGRDASAAASMAKLGAGRLSQKVASFALDSLGVEGLRDGGGPLRGRAAALYRASVAATISGGSAEVQRSVIARRGLGCPAA